MGIKGGILHKAHSTDSMWGGRENKTSENKTRVSRSPHITLLEPVYMYTGYKEAKLGLYRKRRRGVGWRDVIGLLGCSVLNECLEKIKQKQTLKKK